MPVKGVSSVQPHLLNLRRISTVQNQEADTNAWIQGDEKAFEALFRNYYPSLCQSANRLLNDPDEAEETVQNVFISLWEKRENMEIQVSVKSYLYRAVHNAALNRIKHRKVRKQYEEEQLAMVSHAEPASHLSLENELERQIQDAIEGLPEQCRLVFKLSRFEELKYAEIAGRLGISVKTVENHMGKALKVLREKLKDYLVLLIIFLHQILAS